MNFKLCLLFVAILIPRCLAEIKSAIIRVNFPLYGNCTSTKIDASCLMQGYEEEMQWTFRWTYNYGSTTHPAISYVYSNSNSSMIRIWQASGFAPDGLNVHLKCWATHPPFIHTNSVQIPICKGTTNTHFAPIVTSVDPRGCLGMPPRVRCVVRNYNGRVQYTWKHGCDDEMEEVPPWDLLQLSTPKASVVTINFRTIKSESGRVCVECTSVISGVRQSHFEAFDYCKQNNFRVVKLFNESVVNKIESTHEMNNYIKTEYQSDVLNMPYNPTDPSLVVEENPKQIAKASGSSVKMNKNVYRNGLLLITIAGLYCP